MMQHQEAYQRAVDQRIERTIRPFRIVGMIGGMESHIHRDSQRHAAIVTGPLQRGGANLYLQARDAKGTRMIVIVYGYDGSGPGHWQRWLHQELQRRGEAVTFPELPEPSQPQKDTWVTALGAVVDAATSPVTFVCHSLGCWAVDHLLASRGPDKVHAALLVAPPSPFLLFEPVESFLPPPRERAAWAPIAAHSRLVGSDDDDFTSRAEFAELSDELGVPFHFMPGAGHINVASGYGPWPFALQWLRDAGALRP